MISTNRKKTNILYVNDHLGWDNQIHGVSRLFRLWALNINHEKYNVKICILRKKNDLNKPFEEQGIEVKFLNKSRFDPRTLLDLVKVIKREHTDLLHIQGYGSTTFGRLAGKCTGTPVIVHFHDTSPYYPWVQKISDRLLGSLTDEYLAVSYSVRDFWAKRCALNPEEVKVLHNCTSFEEFFIYDFEDIQKEKERLGIKPGFKVIGTVTRLFEEKGTRFLVEAAPLVMKIYPNTVFVIVGDGPKREALEELTQKLNLAKNVIFTGYTERVAPILATFDIKVLTSYAAEGGCPLVVIESMAMGKPVIVTNIVEIVENGKEGLVIPPRDPELLAEKIIAILRDGELAERLGRNALEAAKKFDAKNYVRELEGIYLKAIARHKEKRR